ncbi:MAG TPA: hypothetical protein VGS12_14805 [Caulobacteraceae bacterium]|nr:hypothetical protein [Caulobacteraceae bacterium]
MTEIYTVTDIDHPLHSLISWSAVIAGAVGAIAIGAMLNLLGVALGAGAFNPYDLGGRGDVAGFGVAAGVWVAIANAIALFAGAAIASRAAKYPDLHSGMLHGLMVWAIAFLIAILIAGWTAHGIARGAAQGAAQEAQAATSPTGPTANPQRGAATGVLQSDGTYLQPDGTVTTADGTVVGHTAPPGQGGYDANAQTAAAGTPPAATTPAASASPTPAPTPAPSQKGAMGAATIGLWAFLTMLLGAVGAVLGGRWGARRHAWAARLASAPDQVDRMQVR